ncbi:asparagine synthase-related protein [Embleya sp. NPDC050154]|uniref:asparagine synthase-related protein n=1 Tax=Embleya sp. NPDC050154 TaxID=3363988 RepID=UPI0037BD427D
MPEVLLNRTTAGVFDGTARVGLNACAPWVRDLIASSRLAETGLIDPARVNATLDRTLCGAASHAEIHMFLVTETWLRVLERHRHTWWTPHTREANACV